MTKDGKYTPIPVQPSNEQATFKKRLVPHSGLCLGMENHDQRFVDHPAYPFVVEVGPAAHQRLYAASP
jgi:hypothetical protein